MFLLKLEFPTLIPKSLKRLKNARNRAHRRFLKYGGSQFRFSFVQLRREFQFLHRFLYRNYVWSVEQDLKLNSKRFWVYINKSRKSSGFPNRIVYNDVVSNDLQSSVNLFAEYFSSVYNSDTDISKPSFHDLPPITDIGSLDISESEIISAMKLLDTNSSLDCDNFCNLFLNKCCFFLGLPLKIIFQESLISGVFLARWKSSTISPIFKSGPKHDIGNYRGISKLMVVPKLFESIVKAKIYEKVKTLLVPTNMALLPVDRPPLT